VPVEKTYLRPRDYYAGVGIDLRLGSGVAIIDRQEQRLTLADGSKVPYDSLLLTTGARARRLTLAGSDRPQVLYLRDIEDALRLRERLTPGMRLAVIGAGFIGLEVAATARKRGAQVTVIELAPHVLARVCPPEIGEYVAALHRRNGVELKTGVAVMAIETDGAALALRLSGGDTVLADIVTIGIGAQPNTELAAAAGLTVDDGIVVDEFGRSSDPAIFAAGDVTRHLNPLIGRAIRLEAWQNAQNQGIAVAKIMAGAGEPFSEVPWFWTDQYDMNLQMAGAPDHWDELVWRGAPGDPGFTIFHLAQGKPVAATTVNNARDMRFARMLIARGTAVDAAALADKSVKLQDLCR
jgi:NADPH-dependent 2,4-dienoyl-CoA reductase/sulfur reductase-like enzyme